MTDPTDEPTARERLIALLAREEGDRVGALLALEAAAELADMGELDPRPHFNKSGLARFAKERIREFAKQLQEGTP